MEAKPRDPYLPPGSSSAAPSSPGRYARWIRTRWGAPASALTLLAIPPLALLAGIGVTIAIHGAQHETRAAFAHWQAHGGSWSMSTPHMVMATELAIGLAASYAFATHLLVRKNRWPWAARASLATIAVWTIAIQTGWLVGAAVGFATGTLTGEWLARRRPMTS